VSTSMDPPDDPNGRPAESDPTAPPPAAGFGSGPGNEYAPPPGTGYDAPPPAYGTPPAYGAPPAYGTPPPTGYDVAPAYGGGYGQPAPGYAPVAPYAEWPMRVGATLIDAACSFGILIVGVIIAAVLGKLSSTLGGLVFVLAYLAAIGFGVWQLVVQGQTGKTIGKKVLKISLIAESTGRPIGPGLSIGRAFVHVVDGIPCYLGYLWPLWDPKKQTFADKILHTVVLRAAG